ncbi:glutamate-5-semialdehyde dehydrogenase [Sporomusaceae bacterium BoRhaA]|uniref:glutamate-5-semialdehyde dehydrogenase n=1 Tax=Pelorhabdus rhamnosifermentans TaxID=2772457 RepID=UPI001C0631A2|nr:glutamate-5-semialdehyde dehydrogenase [Pelorhabdus rhamnosifermentans]MBU2699799.1 glutamate-5-semialdehyde dehydrogenase [Pelorhabdus rhamnosifermentans]
MDYRSELETKGKQAKFAARKLATYSSQQKNQALQVMAQALLDKEAVILVANSQDITAGRAKGLSEALLDRLMLDHDRIEAMARGLIELAALPDPIGETISVTQRPNGLEIRQVRVPLGVIAMIYEARPNVTVDAAGICLKTGNAVILRGGSEAIHSNLAIASVLKAAALEAGLPEGTIALIETTDRDAVQFLLKMNDYLDVVIPRGGAGLIQTVVKNSTVPVIETGIGVCHTFIDETADLTMAVKIAFNAKVSRPGVCNAMETLLVHEKIADVFLPAMLQKYHDAKVELRGCDKTQCYYDFVKAATEEDWSTEYHDYILSVKIVPSIDAAIEHIACYSTGHSEAIVTKDYFNARRFQHEVDAAAVYVNASTRFTDGGEFGFGAEIGISTQKLHARGPMGLKEMTSTKYLIDGEGQIR